MAIAKGEGSELANANRPDSYRWVGHIHLADFTSDSCSIHDHGMESVGAL